MLPVYIYALYKYIKTIKKRFFEHKFIDLITSKSINIKSANMIIRLLNYPVICL